MTSRDIALRVIFFALCLLFFLLSVSGCTLTLEHRYPQQPSLERKLIERMDYA